MAILDISKIVMYRFHYDFIMTKYPEAKLLFTVTDSFCYHIPTESDLYDDIRGNDGLISPTMVKIIPIMMQAINLFQASLRMK